MTGIKQLRSGLGLAGWALLLNLVGLGHTASGTLEIAIVTSRDIAPYRAAREGFVEVLDQANISYRTIDYRTEKDDRRKSGLLQKIHSRRPDLILTIGSAATQAVAREVHDIPVIFSLVLEGGAEGALDGLGDNVTGASMGIPVRVQFEKIHEALPHARRFGVLYNPDLTGDVIGEAAEVASDLDLVLVPIAVRSEAEVVEKIADLEGDVDLLWSVADPTVFTPQSVRYILLSTLRNKIPLIGLSPAYVRAGALLSLSCDYRDVGRQSGEQAVQILQGLKPRQIPMSRPRTVSTHLNLNTAKTLDVEVSQPVRQGAQLVSGS